MKRWNLGEGHEAGDEGKGASGSYAYKKPRADEAQCESILDVSESDNGSERTSGHWVSKPSLQLEDDPSSSFPSSFNETVEEVGGAA